MRIDPRTVPLSWRLLIGIVGIAAVGAVLLMLPISAREGALRPSHAAFLSVSALTCTGLSPLSVGGSLSFFGQLVLLALVQVGGVGYMTLAILVLRILGRQVSLTDRLALQDALGVVNLGGVIALGRNVLLVTVGLEALGAWLLYVTWADTVPDSERLWFAIFHSISAFCGSGFDLFGGHPVVTTGYPTDGTTLGIKTVLILLGSVGMPVLFDFVLWLWRRRFTLHTRLTLWATLILTLFGFFMLLLGEGTRGVLAGLPVGEQWSRALFQAVAARSGGFVGLPSFESLQPATQLVVMVLMFIGASPASAGGGITTGTAVTLTLAVVAYSRGLSTPRVAGRAIPGDMVRKAATVLTISLGVVIFATLALLLTHPVSLDRAVFEVVSAFATCGLSLGLTSELNGAGLLIVSLVMLWGRVGALTVVYAFTQRHKPSKIHFPEEKILIG